MLDVEPALGGDEDNQQPQGNPKSSSAGEYLTNFSSAKPELFFNGDNIRKMSIPFEFASYPSNCFSSGGRVCYGFGGA